MPLARFARLDADGGVVTPGLVDPHTHLLFAGTREGELVLRQRGAGYLEILEAGGGILSTVAATRAASEEDLAAHGRRWLDEMLRHGVTTVEAKSGYGLDLQTELRLVAGRLGAGQGGSGRRRPDVPRRACRAPRVPRPPRRDGGLRPERHRGAAAGHRRPGSRGVVRRVLRAGRVHGRPEPAHPPGRGRVRDGDPPPRGRARTVGRGGARGGARRAVRGPPPRPERRGHGRPGRGGDGRAPDGRDAAARRRPGSS